MISIKNKDLVQADSIKQKLEAVNRITNIALSEIENFSKRNFGILKRVDFYEEIKKLEIEMIRYALVKTKGNQKNAAQILNIKNSTLNTKIRKYKLRQIKF